jgi:hypothetical protein
LGFAIDFGFDWYVCIDPFDDPQPFDRGIHNGFTKIYVIFLILILILIFFLGEGGVWNQLDTTCSKQRSHKD